MYHQGTDLVLRLSHISDSQFEKIKKSIKKTTFELFIRAYKHFENKLQVFFCFLNDILT